MMRCLDFSFCMRYRDRVALTRGELIRSFGTQGLAADFVAGMDFSSVDPKMPFEEAVRRFFVKAGLANQRFTLLYSGGIDSEVIAFVAHMSGLKFDLLTIDLYGANRYDVLQAKEFSKRHGIENHRIIRIDDESIKHKWLPELCYDVESPSYLWLAGYIGARLEHKNSPVVIAGEGPTSIYVHRGIPYFSENEYAIWPLKMRVKYNAELFDTFWDAQVFTSFINHPMIADRLNGCNPFDTWFYDARYLSKEYFYTNPYFKSLRRRFSQHGFELLKGFHGLVKDMVPNQDPSVKTPLRDLEYIDSQLYSRLTYRLLEAGRVDSDVVGKLFDERVYEDAMVDENGQSITFGSLARTFYIPVGPILGSCWDNPDRYSLQIVETDSRGQILQNTKPSESPGLNYGSC